MIETIQAHVLFATLIAFIVLLLCMCLTAKERLSALEKRIRALEGQKP